MYKYKAAFIASFIEHMRIKVVTALILPRRRASTPFSRVSIVVMYSAEFIRMTLTSVLCKHSHFQSSTTLFPLVLT